MIVVSLVVQLRLSLYENLFLVAWKKKRSGPITGGLDMNKQGSGKLPSDYPLEGFILLRQV